MIYKDRIIENEDKDFDPQNFQRDQKLICECSNCFNVAVRKLTVLRQINSGLYCSTCASDLCWHGIACDQPENEDDKVMSE